MAVTQSTCIVPLLCYSVSYFIRLSSKGLRDINKYLNFELRTPEIKNKCHQTETDGAVLFSVSRAAKKARQNSNQHIAKSARIIRRVAKMNCS